MISRESAKQAGWGAGSAIAAVGLMVALANWAGWSPVRANREFRESVLAQLQEIRTQLGEIQTQNAQHDKLHRSLRTSAEDLDRLIERALDNRGGG